ncbi:MAG: rhomboid family intramembrane serine protease [Gemmatimonadota bacterium]
MSDEVPLELTDDMLAAAPAQADTRIDLEQGMSYAPRVTLTLIALCVVVFGWEVATGALANSAAIIGAGALSRERVLAGEVWRLATPMVLHGGFGHLFGNCLALYTLGVALEHTVGWARTGGLFVGSGIVASLTSLASGPGPSVGASGAIFGMMGALIVILYRYRSVLRLRDNRVIVVLVAWSGYTLFTGLFTPYVDNAAHVGGLVAGALLASPLRPELLTGRPVTNDLHRWREAI